MLEGFNIENSVPHKGKNLYIDKKCWESLKKFLASGESPVIAFLTELNDYCWKNKTASTLDIGDYKFAQVQDEDKQGWTLVYKGKKIIAKINWQACGCLVETIDEEFKDFMVKNTKGYAGVTCGLDDPVIITDIENFANEVHCIPFLRMELDEEEAEIKKSIQDEVVRIPEEKINMSKEEDEELEYEAERCLALYLGKSYLEKFLYMLNESCYCWKKGYASLKIDGYTFEQIQEGDSCGWTLISQGDKYLGYMKWTASETYVDAMEGDFGAYLRSLISRPCFNPQCTALWDDGEEFQKTVQKIIEVKNSLNQK